MAACPPGPVWGPPPPYDVAHEREFYKYYQPLRLGLADQSPITHSGPKQVRASPDRTLTAFAQLGTLRLNCRRSFISFFDRNHQYLLAEATQTLSLQTESPDRPGDELHYGVSIVPKNGSICEHTIAVPFDLDDQKKDVSIFVVPDLRKDGRFKNKEYTVAKDFVFYAGAPIISPNGYKIGAYCVVDDKPREGLSSEELSFLKDMSTTVMIHMELLRAQSESIKGERMVRGLGSFIEGKSSLEDWWMRPTDAEKDGTTGLSPTPNQRWAERQYSRHHNALSGASKKGGPTSSTLTGLGVRLDVEQPRSRRASHASSDGAVKPMTENPKAKKTSKMDNLPIEVKHTFGRASHILRESLQIDAVVIFDATARSTFGGLADQADNERPKRRKVSSSSEDADTSGSFVGPGSGSEQSSSDSENSEPSDKEEENPAEILGFSTPDMDSINGDQDVTMTDGMTEGFLRSLLRRYPHGKVLNFDERGHSPSLENKDQSENNSGSVSPKSSTKKRKRLRSSEAKQLRKMFPNVRSLAIVPMWDSNQKFFSACVAWTIDPHRILTSHAELSYLAAFSDCVMSETSRINAKIADKAKSDFISSISHELRSPLHGILGSVECLQDSVLDPFQENLIHTMETCGKTLLDTIDHLLDFAKINNFTRKSNPRRSATSDPHGQKQNFALDVDVDLSVITEEVLETVFAGHDFMRAGQDSEHMPINKSLKSSGSKRDVSVVVDINKARDSHWIFRTQAGAWRRILMNLFGNSLKYTEHGFIQVKLEAEPLPKKAQGGESKVTLTVADSGKGMSRDYLDKKLFVPFAQEDSLQPGTGLGLAITSAIIRSMGGNIDVQSEKGKGTQITVSLKMMHAPRDENSSEQSVIFSAAKRTKGLKIGFVGFDADSTQNVPKPNSRSPENADHLFMSSFHRMCQNWFQMDMHVMHGLDQADADVFLTTEKGFAHVSDELDKKMQQQSDKDAQSEASNTPLLVICNSVASANAMMHSKESHVSGVISQPCGPRKLAKALTLCLESFKVSQDPNKSPPTMRKVIDENIGKEQDVQDSPFRASLQSQKRSDAYDMSGDPEATPKQTEAKLKKIYENTSGSESQDKKKLQDSDPPIRHPRKETLQIPQGKTRVPKEDNSPLADHSSQHERKNVCKLLLVDDNKINLQLLVTFVKKSGHAFMTASNGLEAFEAYKAQCEPSDRSEPADSPFDYVLMDISMPVMDGLESTRKIRAYERQAKIKPTTIIALTGLASAQAQQEAFGSGIDTFMTKPVKLKELNKLVEDGIKKDGERKDGERKDSERKDSERKDGERKDGAKRDEN